MELPTKTPGKTPISARGGTESGTVGAPEAVLDPELRRLAEGLLRLSAEDRERLAGMLLGE